MNKQRKVVITTTYNEMGIIIDTKVEEVAQPNLQPSCNHLATDTISRQAAIDALKNRWKKTRNYEGIGDDIAEECELYLKQVPSAQPEPCEDAVSRQTLKDGFTEMCNLICPYTKKQQHVMCGSCLMGTAFDVLEATPSVTPKQRTGKWILDRSGAYCCSECMEPCAGYVMMKPRDKFCKMCGAKMEVTE